VWSFDLREDVDSVVVVVVVVVLKLMVDGDDANSVINS